MLRDHVLKHSKDASNTINKEMTMANWFEDVTKTLADEKIGRRTALRRVGGTVAGVALAGAIPGMALAKVNKHCPQGGNCTIGFTECQKQGNSNCFCFTDTNGKGACGCNSYCSQIPTCSDHSDSERRSQSRASPTSQWRGDVPRKRLISRQTDPRFSRTCNARLARTLGKERIY
jgi:hypothetical protein